MSEELKQTLDELTSTHRPYETITSYTCSIIIPDDETTEITIKTKSTSVSFATSLEDANAQTKYENKYSKKSYASYILGYVKKHLSTLDTKTAVLTYDEEPIVKLMNDEEIEVWEREVLDANAY
jgi:hypothetical protein